MSTEAESRSSLPVSDFLLVLALAAGCYLAVHGAWFLPVLQHTATGIVVMSERPPFTRLDDAVPGVGVVHELAGAAFLLIAIFDFLTGVINGWNDWMRRRLGLYITFINAASLYNYYSLWSGTVPLVYDHLNRAFAPTRLVHWTFTSTLMVGMMGALGNAPFPRIANALFVQFMCLSCGFLFHYLWQPWCYVAFLFNFSCFVLTLRNMWNFLTLALKSALTEEDERVIVTFRLATVCVWSLFSVMILGKLRLVSHLTEEIVLVIADFLSKGLVSLTLYHLNTISPDRLELVYLLMQQNIIVDPETVAKTKRSIESLQRIVDAAFSETPIHDRDTLALLRQLRDADQQSTDETDLNSETDKVAIASRKVLFDFKRKFLTRMRAEFKTPLNHIIAASNSVLHLTPLATAGPVSASTPVTGERRDALLHVMASAQSLLMDVDNMLEFVNFQAQQMQLPGPSMATNVEFSLVALLDSVYDFALQRGADQWGRVELLISRHPHCPTMLIGDPYRMFLVLRNLVDNAIKHTPSGLVRVHVGFEPIARKRLPPGAQLLPKSAALSAANLRKMARAARDHIMFDEHSDSGADEQTGEQIMLIVHVVDSGSGIDAAMIQDIASVKSLGNQGYLRFNKAVGLGLGLAVCRFALESMEGTLAISPLNPYTRGSSLAVQVPFFVSAQLSTEALRHQMPLRLPAPQQKPDSERIYDAMHVGLYLPVTSPGLCESIKESLLTSGARVTIFEVTDAEAIIGVFESHDVHALIYEVPVGLVSSESLDRQLSAAVRALPAQRQKVARLIKVLPFGTEPKDQSLSAIDPAASPGSTTKQSATKRAVGLNTKPGQIVELSKPINFGLALQILQSSCYAQAFD